MNYLAVVGFAMMILITVLLFKKKVSTLFSFSVIPVVAALLIGTSIADLGSYIAVGIGKTYEITLLMLFALPYFSLMNDTGLFDYMVKGIFKRVKISVPVLMIITVLVACIGELDGSVTSTNLITIPLMLPLYKKYGLDKRILPFLTSVAILIMCNLPWNARVLRAASLLTNMDDSANAASFVFTSLAPLQIILLIGLFGYAVFLGVRDARKNGIKGSIDSAELSDMIEETELSKPNLFWFNAILTIIIVLILCLLQSIPSYFVFAVGLVIGLMVNYPDMKFQDKLLSKYASSLFPLAPAVLLSGVVVGVMQESGMLEAMVEVLVSIVPNALGPYVYLIIALLSTPLMLLFTNDTWYYALIPLIAGFSAKYGVSQEVVVLTLFMNFGAMVSPVAQPQLYLAADLTDGLDLSEYIKYTFWKLWGVNVVWVVIGFILGIFR